LDDIADLEEANKLTPRMRQRRRILEKRLEQYYEYQNDLRKR